MKRSALIASRERPFHKRIRLACTFCRKRKVRCDGGQPCSFCRHLGTEPCVYAGAQPRVSPSTSASASASSSSSKITSPVKKSKGLVTTSLSSSSVPSCSSSPTSCLSASSSSSIDFDNVASTTSTALPTVQIEQWQELLTFSNLTAEYDATLYNKEEEGDTTLMPPFDDFNGNYLNSMGDSMWQPMSYGASMSSSSFTSSPASSSSLGASPLSTMQGLSPPWNNTHHWTTQYLDPNTCSFSQLTSPTDATLAGDALGLQLRASSNTTDVTSNSNTLDSLYLSFSAMADSDLFRRRALAYLSQIDQ